MTLKLTTALLARAFLFASFLFIFSCGGSNTDTLSDDTELAVTENSDTNSDTSDNSDTGGDNENPEHDSDNNPANTNDSRLIDHNDIWLTDLSDSAVANAKATLHIAYQHTSHGSQLITGMNSLQGFPPFGEKFRWSDNGEAGSLDLDDYGIRQGGNDLSQGDSVDDNGDTPWVTGTRELLNNSANSHINVVIWSWCSLQGHNAQRYLDNMEKLVAEYPEVVFVFMTGHAEGLGEDLSVDGVHYNNELIRSHAATHKRWLFDFADIESFDPDGNYYWDLNMRDNLAYSDGNWAQEWLAANPEQQLATLTTGNGMENFNGTAGCAHSSSPAASNLNCVLKGIAAWHLFTRIAAQLNQG